MKSKKNQTKDRGKNYGKSIINTKTIREMASKQCDSINVLELFKKMIDLVPSPNDEKVKRHPAVYYAQVYEALELMFVGLQKITKDLDDNASILFSTAERAELEALGVVIDPMFDEEK